MRNLSSLPSTKQPSYFYTYQKLPRSEHLVINESRNYQPQLMKLKNGSVKTREYQQEKYPQLVNLKQIIVAKSGNVNEYKKYQPSLTAAEKQILELRSYKQLKQNQIKQFQQIYENTMDLQRQLENCKLLSNELARLSQPLASKKQQVNNFIGQKKEEIYESIYGLKFRKSSPKNQSQQKRKEETRQQINTSNFQDSKKITDLQSQLRKSKLQKQQLHQEVDQLKEQLRLKSGNYNFRNKQNQSMNSNSSSKKFNYSIMQLETKLKEKDKEINDLKDSLNQRNRAWQNKEKNVPQIQTGKLWAEQQIVKQCNDFQKQRQKYQNDIRNLEKQLEEQKRISGNLTNEIKSLRASAQETLGHLTDQKEKNYSMANEIQRLKIQAHKTSKELENQKAKSNTLNQEISRIRAETYKISSVGRYQSLFAGEVLDQSKQCKEYLAKILQEKIGLRISKTKLIYRFDRYSKSNFHQYFDNKEQLVLLVRTINDFIFGGWTESGFIPRTKSDKSGLLFSLTNQKCFELSQPNRKAITYDEFHIIFGNSEIVIQSLKDQVNCNFGISNGFYDCRGCTVNLMLGAGETREVKIKTYEIFQLSLQKK